MLSAQTGTVLVVLSRRQSLQSAGKSLVAPPGKLEKGSGRLVGGQLCGHVPQLVQVSVKALAEGAAPAKSSIFFKKIWSQQGRQYGCALWTKWVSP